MSCLIWHRARGKTTHIQVKKFVLADFFDIYCVAQQFYSIYPASEYRTFCPAIELSPVVHRGLSAVGQLVTLGYRGKINDLTLWVGFKYVFHYLCLNKKIAVFKLKITKVCVFDIYLICICIYKYT